MKSIYILRHGQTDYNKRGVLQGRAIDSSLNKLGKKQADAFYDYYKNEGFDWVISSDLQRSIQSIERFRSAGIKHEIDSRITEFSWGENEGKPLDQLVVRNYKKMLAKWAMGDMEARIPGGESGQELFNRVKDFSLDIQRMPESKILICTHGRTLKMLVVVLLNWDISEMEKVRHSNAALFKLELEDEKFELKLDNDLSHLPAYMHQNAYWDK